MALPATDAFTDTNGTALTTHSASWTENVAGFDIQSNALASNGASDTMAHWNADTFNDDQYAQIVEATTSATGSFLGPAVRVATSAHTGYYCVGQYAASTDWETGKFVGGTWTAINSNLTGPSNGTTVAAKISGTSFTVEFDGTPQASYAFTDSAISSGSGGVCGYGTSASRIMDTWEAGNLGGGGTNPKGVLGLPIHGPLQRVVGN